VTGSPQYALDQDPSIDGPYHHKRTLVACGE
jgi:hypothetical protein